MKFKYRLFILVIPVMLGSGCAVFRHHKVPDAGPAKADVFKGSRTRVAVLEKTPERVIWHSDHLDACLRRELTLAGVNGRYPEKMEQDEGIKRITFEYAKRKVNTLIMGFENGWNLTGLSFGERLIVESEISEALDIYHIIKYLDGDTAARYVMNYERNIRFKVLMNEMASDKNRCNELLSPGEAFILCESSYKAGNFAISIPNAILSGLTLTLLPSTETYTLKTRVTAVNDSGMKFEKSYEESYRLVVWALFFPYLFSSEHQLQDAPALATENLARTAVNDIIDSGLFGAGVISPIN